jgi:hypothetical protein
MDASRVARVREEMERAEARRLQPHFIRSFFIEAFERLGGTVRKRESHRYEVTHVPATMRGRDRTAGFGEPVLPKYERIAFEKDHIAIPGSPLAAFVCPGHALLDAVLDLTLDRHRDLLRRGALLVDERDPGTDPRVLFFLEHAIQDAHVLKSGERRAVSRRMLYVELDAAGNARRLNYAPYLDYRPLSAGETEQAALHHAIASVVPEHLDEVRQRRTGWIDKTRRAVKERLAKEINYWDHRAAQLKAQEAAGKPNARLNSQEAARRAEALDARLKRRLAELERESQMTAASPVVLGGAVVVPAGLLAKLTGRSEQVVADAIDRLSAAAKAREIVMECERRLGNRPIDRELEKLGYDIESRDARTGRLRFIEVKGRRDDAETITVSKNEILYSLNKPDDFILAIVAFNGMKSHRVHYVRRPFQREPDFGVASVNYEMSELIKRGEEPS